MTAEPEGSPDETPVEGTELTAEEWARHIRDTRQRAIADAIESAGAHSASAQTPDDEDYNFAKEVMGWITGDAARGTSAFSASQVLAFYETALRWMNLAGEWAQAVRVLEVLTSGDAPGAAGELTRLRAVAYGWLAWFHELLSQYDASRQAAEHACVQAELTGDLGLLSRSLSRLAKTYRTRGYYDEALHLYRRACQSAAASHDAASLAAVLNSTGLTLWHLGELEDALDHVQRAWRCAAATPDRRQQAQVLVNLGLVKLTLGAYADARRDLEAALPLAEELSDFREMGVICGNLGEVLFHLRARDDARRTQERAALLADGRDPSAYRGAKARLRLSRLHRDGTDPAELERARELARAATELGEGHRLHHFEILGRSYEAMACLALGRREEALALSREAVRRLRRSLKRKQWLDGSPAEVFFNHHRVLDVHSPRRARAALAEARRQLDAQAGRLRDPQLRDRFLHEIALHAEILST